MPVSVMGSLFSTCDKNNGNVAPKRALTVTDRDRAELGLKNSRDKLQKYKKTVRVYIFLFDNVFLSAYVLYRSWRQIRWI